MNEMRNLTFAALLSLITLLLWDYFIAAPQRQEIEKARQAEQEKFKLEQSKEVPSTDELKPKVLIDRAQAVSQAQRVTIETDKLKGSISLKGGRLDDLILKEYKQTIKEDSDNVVMLSPSGTREVYFGDFGWLSGNNALKLPDSHTQWQAGSARLSKNTPLRLTWDNGAGLAFNKTITVDDNYMFTVRQEVTNNTVSAINLSPYSLINRTRADELTFFISHEGAIGAFDDILYETTFDELKDEKKQSYKSVRGWIGFGDKYWISAIIPPGGESFDASFNYTFKNDQHRYQIDVVGQSLTIGPGETKSVEYLFYAGAKKVGLLDTYEKSLNIPLFDHAVDFGSLYFLTKPIFHALTFFHGFLGNFGLAIILFTVCLRIILFPLANKSFKSMSHMRKVAPQMQEMRERYKDDKMRLQQEMMDLYKREKINPLSGCLPILIQLPIFFAIYKVLFVTIEMRQTPFYGWLKDLSVPDPTSLFNLFGLLPFDPPGFLMIGVLPLLMGITMFIQQKFNPPPPDPIQAQIMQALPFIFVFLFASFPAGLILYWVVNNILSILQQWVINRSVMAEDSPAVKKAS